MPNIRKRGSRYYIRYTDPDGVRHETEGYTDRRVAEWKARQVEVEVEKIKAKQVTPQVLALRDHATRPVSKYLDEYRLHLIAKGSTAKHAELACYRARRVVEKARVDRLADLSASRVQTALRSILDEKPPTRKGR